MYIALTVLIILACALLVLAVLVQNPKGGGLAVGFSASNQVMGVRKTTDFLEKFTWGLLITLIVFCLLGTIILKTGSKSTAESQIQEKAQSTGTTASQPVAAPRAPGQQPPQPVQPNQQNP